MGGSNENVVLRRILSEIGWSPYELARAVNRIAPSDRRIHASTPFTWRDRGVLPREPLPSLVAGVLSEARGIPVTVEQLWQGRAVATCTYQPALVGTTDPWTVEATLRLLDTLRTPTDTQIYFAHSGSDLLDLANVWAGRAHPRIGELTVPGSGRVRGELVDYLANDLTQLRRLDDGHGGQLVLRTVMHRLALATELLRESSYSSAMASRLVSTVGEMAQLAGWLNFDLGRHGLAQRMYMLALRAAAAIGDRQLGGLVLSCIAFQQTWRDRPTDAVAILDVASRAVTGAATPRVRALLAMREARAHATVGDARRTMVALDTAERALSRGRHDDDPGWIYWMDEPVLTNESGRCLLHLGMHEAAQLKLSEGLALLDGEPSRDRILYGLSLSLAQIRAGSGRKDLEHACATAAEVVPMLSDIGSARCRRIAGAVTSELRGHRGVAAVRSFLDRTEATIGAI